MSASRAGPRTAPGRSFLAEVQKQSDAAGKLDWAVSIDSTIARVHQHGATLGRDTGRLCRITRNCEKSRLITGSAGRVSVPIV